MKCRHELFEARVNINRSVDEYDNLQEITGIVEVRCKQCGSVFPLKSRQERFMSVLYFNGKHTEVMTKEETGERPTTTSIDPNQWRNL